MTVQAAGISSDDMGAAVEALQSARRVTAICHENPDADSVAAAISIRLIAERLGSEAEVVSADGIPETLAFLPYASEVRLRPEFEPDLAVVCDAANLERVGRLAIDEADWFARTRLLNIDHHVSGSRYGHINLVDPSAAATCEVLALLVAELGVQLDEELSGVLLTGIIRDSQGFTEEATSARTLAIASRLVGAGASLGEIHRRVVGELPSSTLTLWGQVLSAVATSSAGKIVYAAVTQEMLAATGTSQNDAEGLVEFMLRSQGSEVALLLRELDAGRTRVSVRTKGRVDAIHIVRSFGGGGHERRAGCVVDRSITDVLRVLLSQCERVLAGYPGRGEEAV